MTPVHDELLALIAAGAEEADASRRLPQAMFGALYRSGLLGIKLPREVGGADLDLVAQFDVIEALARVDGAAAWNVAFMGSSAGIVASHLPDAGVASVRGDGGAWPPFAGTFPPSGVATPVDGGVRVSGRWTFASGIHHAAWVVAGCVRDDRDELVWCVLPVASVAVDDTWDALGLRGTGSCDYSVDDVFVPAERTFHVTEPPRRGGHVHRLPMHAFLTPDHTAVTLGSARRAIDAAAQQSIGKVRLGSTTALDARATFRRDLGRSATRLRAARALVREVLAELDAADNVPAELLLEARVAATHAAEAAVEVATFAYRSGGAHAVSDRSDVGRAYRDTMTSTQHVHVLDDVYEQLGDLTLRPQAPGTS